ncbi:MAG TPA: alpha-amylase family glycosyl hydrolase [Acidobacteriaceae bacterium]|jgi:glycosidase|nr:alpha-amylase family glycosyl hydrolase [Acidobacteriaceae bacterium]
MRFWSSYFLAALLACMSAVCSAQATGTERPQAGRSGIDKIKIDKIDPPNWWAGLPSPMLLVHGQGLKNAQFTVSGNGVTVMHTQVSGNGHWAFLWIDTHSAPPQTLEITAGNDQGHATRSYRLVERSHDPHAHSGFSATDVLYLIMPDRFAKGPSTSDPSGDNRAAPRGWHGGNLAGIEQHLDYLQKLGVTALWITPIVSNGAMPDSYHGYAATDLYKVDPHFGTLAEYQQLSAALHTRGMKLVIDMAPNHIGLEHPWVNDPPAPDWLHGSVAHHRNIGPDFHSLVDPHAPPQAWLDTTTGWFANPMPDLNQENPLVEKYMIQNALWWVETANLDGIRFDTFPYVGRAFWRDLDGALYSVYPHLTTVGEVFDRSPRITSFFAGGWARRGADGTFDTGLYTPFDFPVCFAIQDVLTQGKPMTELSEILGQDSLYPHPERLVTFIGNHDMPRFLTQAGGDPAKLKLALGLIATLRGMPLIYSGDEIGMTGGADPDNRHDFPGGFAGDPHSAFTESGRTTAEEDVFRWSSGLLAYRAAHAELKTGMEQNLFADADVFAFVRSAEISGCSAHRASERLLIVVNKGPKNETVYIPTEDTALAGCSVFVPSAAAPGVMPRQSERKLQFDQPAESMSIYAVR